MKSNRWNRFLAAFQGIFASPTLVVTFIGLTAGYARSAVLTWDIAPGTVGAGDGAITGGAGEWNTADTLGNWTTDGGATNVAWVNNVPPDGAIFSGTGGTVTQTDVVVNSMTFSSAYTVAGGILTLAGASPTITTDANATVSSALAGTEGMIKNGSAILTIPTRATYTGGTVINGGILNLSGGAGESGTIRGTVTVNNGGILRLATGDATGWGGGALGDRLDTININEGSALNINVTANQTLGHASIHLTGGAITDVPGNNLDFFQGTSSLNSRASDITSTSNGTRLNIRQTPGLTITVEEGTTPSGIDLDVGSVISSHGSFTTAPLIKAGDGTMLLRAANTYTGATAINEGTFILGPGGSAPGTDITVATGSIFRLASTGKTLKSLTINDGATLTIAAGKTATTTITNALTTNGTINLKPVFMDVPAASDVYTLASAASSSGTATFTVDLSGFGESRIAATAAMAGNNLQLTITGGAADLIWNNNAATGLWNLTDANFNNGGSPDVFKTYDGVTFNGTAPGTITLVGNLHPSLVTVNSSTGDYTFAGSGGLTGGTLTKSGTSTLTLSNTNSHPSTVITGGVLVANALGSTGGLANVNGGALHIADATGLGSGTLVLNSGSFDNLTGAAATLSNLQTWNGAFTFTGTQNLTTTGGVSLTGNSQISVEANSLIANGVISGAFGLTKTGAGTLQLNAPHTYSGPTAVSGNGRLWISNTLRNTSSLTVGEGSTLELGATNIFVPNHGTTLPDAKVITVNGGTLLMNTATDTRFGNVTLNNGATWTSNRGLGAYDALMANVVSGPATLTVGGTGTSVMNGGGGIHLQGVQNFAVADTTSSPEEDLVVDMILAGPGTTAGAAGGINKTGPGTMVFNGVNTYLGSTTVNEGTLQIGGSGAVSGSDFIVNAATLQIDGTNKTLNSLTATDGATLALAAKKGEDIFLTGDLTTSGAVTLRPLFIDVPATGDTYDLLSASNINSGATYTVDMDSLGTTRVSASVTTELGQYLVLSIDSGAADLVWNNAAATGVWNLDGDANFNNGGSPDVFKSYDGVTFGNTAAGTVNLAGTLNPGQITVDSTADYTFGGTGMIGSGQLVKSGSSILTLASAQMPAGITINGGTVNIAHPDAAGTGPLTLAGGVLSNGTGDTLSLANAQIWETAASFSGDNFVFGTAGVTLASDTDVTVGPNDVTLSGPVNGSGFGFSKGGSGTLSLNGVAASTIARLEVDAGTVAINTNSGIPVVEVGGGPAPASLVLDGSQVGNRLAPLASVLVENNGTVVVNGVNALPNHANSVNFTVEAGGTLIFGSGGSPAIGAAGVSHHHLGNLTLNGGSVVLPYSGEGAAYNNESVQINGTLLVGGTSPSTIEFGSGATPTNAGFALHGTTTHFFTVEDVTGDPASDLIIRAELENSDTAPGTLVKDGPGTMELAGGIAHSHTGSTTVAEGTLAGNGSLAGPLIVEIGAVIAPGSSTGTLGAGDTTIAGTYACEIDGSESDSLAVTGDLDISGAALDISVLSGGATQPTYVIATYTGALTGTFASTPGLPTGYSVNYNTALQRIEITTGVDPYSDWAASNGVEGAGPGVDSDNDGIPNGIEFVIGGDPSGPGSNSNQLLPTIASDATHLIFTFRRTDESVSYAPRVEYGSALTGWTDAVNGVGGVQINETDNGFGAGVDRVEVRIPRSLATNSKLFARLKVTVN